MALISLQNVSMKYGGPMLLNGVSLQIESSERICLVGRNGEGKSTLLRLISGEEKPDSGTVIVQSGVRVGFMPQSVPRELPGSVHDIVSQGTDGHLEEWESAQLVRKTIAQMGLDGGATFSSLSGGQKRRTLLAQALVHEPDVLVLDEPTNHLDIESIQWLESFLMRYPGSLLFVTHDRAFLRRLATRIVELDRGNLTSWAYGYDRYLDLRRELLEAEEKQNALFDKKLAQEETWIRQGVKARRTRNEGRVRALKALRVERSKRREITGSANMQIQQGELSGRKVVALKNASYTWGNEPIVKDLTVTIMRGDKVGIIGPNGCGKTTLLRMLLGQLAPQSGSVEHGTNMQIAYFDQHRETLDDNRTVAQNVAGDNDHVTVDGRRRHIVSYLEDFLFPPDRSRSPIRILSGGERNRLLLARLFTRPSNVLVLDEPTNDLDAETLELLEDLLVEYSGTLLVVSHDREFLNNVVSSTLVFEGDGKIAEFVGGYDDWVQQRQAAPAPGANQGEARTAAQTKSKKLSNKQRQELEALPARIEALEAELAELERSINDPAFYKQSGDAVALATARYAAIPHELDEAFARWGELEKMANE